MSGWHARCGELARSKTRPRTVKWPAGPDTGDLIRDCRDVSLQKPQEPMPESTVINAFASGARILAEYKTFDVVLLVLSGSATRNKSPDVARTGFDVVMKTSHSRWIGRAWFYVTGAFRDRSVRRPRGTLRTPEARQY